MAICSVVVQDHDQGECDRLILLGASNLTRALPTVVHLVNQLHGAPLSMYAALGHGRSYGMRSSIAFGLRTLPSILGCGMWDAIARTSGGVNRRSFGLITDIGNDIMYGASPGTIADWVEQCIDRLEERGADVTMTMIPIKSIRLVKPWQFRIVKAMLFPTRQLQFEQAISRANELHELLVTLAERRGVRTIDPLPNWYGFDPIHIQRRWFEQAWRSICEACLAGENSHAAAGEKVSARRWMQLKTIMPQEWWLAGVKMSRRQPAAIFPTGTTVSLF